MRPTVAPVGNPPSSRDQVPPASVDFQIPLHGPRKLAAARSSTKRARVQVALPSVVLKTPVPEYEVRLELFSPVPT
jgi:hypothetical protein